MRINLNVSYPQKDEAKALGARWDAARKTWYIENVEDLTPFIRWIPVEKALRPSHKATKQKKPRVTTSAPVFDCGCDHIPPWQDCEHSDAAASQEMLSSLSIQ